MTDAVSPEKNESPRLNLVMYAYFIPHSVESAALSLANMNFFLRHAVSASPNVDFVFLRIEGSIDSVIPTGALGNQGGRQNPANHSAPLATDSIEWQWVDGLSNVWGCNVPNMKADICSYNDLIAGPLENMLQKSLSLYKHFFFVNCGVRGPFFHLDLNSAIPRAEQWLRSFTDRLSPRVLIIGPTLSCQLDRPHVQSYAVAMTQATYKWFASDAWSNCSNKTKTAIIMDSEIGLSDKITSAGFGIGSLMARQRDIFTSAQFMVRRDICPKNNPTTEPLYPHEVQFVKFGGQIFRDVKGHNLIHPKTIRRVEAATLESGQLLDLYHRLKQRQTPTLQNKCRVESVSAPTRNEYGWWPMVGTVMGSAPPPQQLPSRQDGLPIVPWRTAYTTTHNHLRPLEVAVVLRVSSHELTPVEGSVGSISVV
jgi:hypothetical protein